MGQAVQKMLVIPKVKNRAERISNSQPGHLLITIGRKILPLNRTPTGNDLVGTFCTKVRGNIITSYHKPTITMRSG